ncbi:ATP-binding protein [Pantanalinema sp. GBBB05]|uniref:ATP-binding protein n=1 Tax=Pantanalinema sp. GBBB05 TaxID=2604139 RepID=UPI001D9EED3C|nr:response regulator [Pantanalinema sp. GBBB05]
MKAPLLTLEVYYEQDVVLIRQRARQIAELIGFDTQDQVRIATAVSEIARNAFQYAKTGRVEFRIEGKSPQILLISVQDRGVGIAHLQDILAGRYTSQTGMGVGILGSRRLMDQFQIESSPGHGTSVLMGKYLPQRLGLLTPDRMGQIVDELARRSPQNAYEEIQRQNQELLQALEALRQREDQLTQLNRELEDTNRGVVALYAELDEKADSLKRANELKTRFLSNMSHEFRTPLNSIMSLTRLLLDRLDGDLTVEQEKQVVFIRKAAEGLSELVNDLLDLAKVEAGKIVVHPTTFEVSELFATLRGMLRPLLMHNTAVNLLIEEPTNIPPLCTDEGKVAQILRNFISNALKYTEQGEVRVSATQVEDQIVLSVADTGIGIAPEHQERVFEDFVQVESPLQRRVKGTGLGLPLSRKLAELLGGTIQLNSRVGVGSTFSVAIPIVYASPGDQAAIVPMPLQLDPQRLPILVIEDQPETLFTYEKYLAGSSYQLIAAQTLEQAYQALAQIQPLAIVLDVLLEGENTWSFLTQMKENIATRSIPILVVTVVDNEKQAKALGADAFLVKPVDRLTLLNQLNTLLNPDHQQTLLLIDDDLVVRYLLKQQFFTAALTILEAANGNEGVHLAQQAQPQAIILDLVMPDLNGIEVLERLKTNPATQHIPVIIHTSHSLDSSDRQALEQQVVAIISKDSSPENTTMVELQEALVKAGLALNTEGDDHG